MLEDPRAAQVVTEPRPLHLTLSPRWLGRAAAAVALPVVLVVGASFLPWLGVFRLPSASG
ncbi:MAG TPA: hypothetical protein VMM13_00495 [Euzebya sp.]|nr:hypothetical protein [Euzebya sp.]